MSDRCDQLPGRLRDICRGHDDAGAPVLTPEKCEAYRKLWFGEEPGLLEKATSLGAAIMRHIAGGCRSVSQETFENRLAICRSCDRMDLVTEKCLECGCKLKGNLLAKLRMPNERCPLPSPKWDIEST